MHLQRSAAKAATKMNNAPGDKHSNLTQKVIRPSERRPPIGSHDYWNCLRPRLELQSRAYELLSNHQEGARVDVYGHQVSWLKCCLAGQL